MSILVLIPVLLGSAEPPPDMPQPEASLQTQAGEKPDPAAKACELSPLEPRSTAEWRRFFVQWRQRAVEAVPDRYPLTAKDLSSIARVRDGQAVPALVTLLKQERDLRIRAVYIETLGRIETTLAVQTLVAVSLDDKTEWLQRLAAEQIGKMFNRDEAIEPYARALRNGRHRDRALEALKISGLTSPRSSSELPNPTLTTALIDALWVPEIEWVERELYWEGLRPNPVSDSRFNYGWDYERGLVPVKKLVKHPVVHETLGRYTAVDYGYDQAAWQAWYRAHGRETR